MAGFVPVLSIQKDAKGRVGVITARRALRGPACRRANSPLFSPAGRCKIAP
jgi:hypothetical protein